MSTSTNYTRISDMLYVLYKPADNEKPVADIILFHGLQPEAAGYDNAYWKSWMSLSRGELKASEVDPEAEETPICWPEMWLGPELKTARISSIKYDPSLFQTAETGRVDMHNLVENLVQDILFSTGDLWPKVGQQPIFLVGHSVGCYVIKEFLLHAQKKAGLLRDSIELSNLADGDPKVREHKTIRTFLGSVKGLFFYSPPFRGSRLAAFVEKIPRSTTSPMLRFLKIFSEVAARSNQTFQGWRFKRMPIMTVVESWITREWGFNGVVVDEASARVDTDNILVAGADHFTVIRPKSRKDIAYQALVDFYLNPPETKD